MSIDIDKTTDGYQRLVEERGERLRAFHDPESDVQFIVIQRPSSSICNECNTIEAIVRNNLAYLEAATRQEGSDDLPYLEPWVGTGVYANAFGCECVWRDFDAPHTHYRFHSIDEIEYLEPPDCSNSPLMTMVLDAIDALKEATKARIPIALTDTQSAFDTATLILDASEFFTACYTEPETVTGFMKRINDCIIDFSKNQMERIGDGLVAKPGHIMTGAPFLSGISISDDNLAVSSPEINKKISLPFNAQLAAEFDGLAIHSCGEWTHTMRAAASIPGVMMLDMALGRACDPNPNDPVAVREAVRGKGVIVKARVGGNMREIEDLLRKLYAPDLKIAVDMGSEPGSAERNYHRIHELCASLAEKREVAV